MSLALKTSLTTEAGCQCHLQFRLGRSGEWVARWGVSRVYIVGTCAEVTYLKNIKQAMLDTEARKYQNKIGYDFI